MKQTIICGLTEEAIKNLKQKHGSIFLVTISDEAGAYQAVCKEPSMEVFQATQALMKTDEMKASVAIYDNCVLERDEEIEKRFVLKLQVAKAIGERLSKVQVSSKNL
jgi:hypothetical protein